MVASPALGTRIVLEDSIVPVPGTRPGPHPRVGRTTLTAEEMAAPLDFVVSLRMRDFKGLEARIQSGQTVPQQEMEARYLPLRADYERVTSWLRDQGFALTLQDKNHTNVYACGSVGRIAGSLSVTFARVVTADGEFTSAVTAPAVPEEISSVVLTVVGLQPHILMHALDPQASAGTNIGGRVLPADVLAAYGAPTGNDGNGQPITGSGQTIAVIMGAAPLTSDLSAFWQAAGITDSLDNYALVNVGGGPTASSQSTNLTEVTLDAEWATAIAPGAKLRVYAIPSLNLLNLEAACTQIINDGGVSIVSYCACGPEVDYSDSLLQSCAQSTAQIAAAGITMVVCSGDGGSNPNPVGSPNGYSTSNALSAEYPATDPSVTGVGGTTMVLDKNWNATSESVWSQIGTVTSNPLASGGGISTYFSQPSWQAGPGMPTTTMRCVPDVAALAATDPQAGGYTGGFVILSGQQAGFVGTSLSTPVWAGVVAMVNQYRASMGLPNVGLLNPWIYTLIGTNAFNDTTTGSIGAYQAGTGYDLCTGAGTPNVNQLIIRTTQEIKEVAAPTGPVNAGSSVTMSVTPQFLPSTYQWKLDGIAIPGATGSVYNIPTVSTGDGGTYTVVITNSQLGALTYTLGTLTVNATQPPPTTAARLINISTRAQVGTGSNILIPGFVVSGSGTETLLIRADGPALTQFGVGGVLAQPSLSVFDNTGKVIASNTGWGSNPNPALIASTAASVGAFALASGSADCALIISLQPGAYTAQISGVGNTTGVALAEIYEVSSTGTRLINISTRAQVGTGANILIPGFVVSGSGTEQLLVRGDGPSLGQFGVAGFLAQPSLGVFGGNGTVLASNTGWCSCSNPAVIASTATSVGAFALASGSADSAQVINLSPGAYTMQVSGVGGTTGVALAEVYEVP